METDPEKVDDLVVAKFAEWAGDTAFAIGALLEYERTVSKKRQEDPSEVFLDRAASERLINLVEARRESRSELIRYSEKGLTTVFPIPGSNINDDDPPTEMPIVESTNLRGVVHIMSERQFELRAFLKNLSWEQELFKKVEELSTEPTERKKDQLNDEVNERGRSGSWVIEGDLFREIEVDDLGLITARGTWTKSRLPETPKPIFDAFKEVLRQLDSEHTN